MRFLLRATAEQSDNWYGYAWVEVDPAQARAIMAMKEAFQAGETMSHRARGQSLYQLWLWDHGTLGTARFYEELDLEDFLTEEEIETFDHEEVLVVPDERQLGDAFEEADEERTDADQVIVEDYCIRFFAYQKYVDHGITTAMIKYETLLPLLEEPSCES